jgi:2,4-dichlorophenol 6-monooxygenase
MIETDVLIIGSGPAGSTAALALSTYGIRNILVSKYGWVANSPRAHVTNQRSFEVLRDLGVEAEARALAVPLSEVGKTIFCTSLAGEELGRVYGFGSDAARAADYTLSSPCMMGDLPQHLMEPILVGTAASRGTRLRFDTEYLSHVQDDSGVTATVLDRLSGETYQIRAKYLIGADGGRSKVAEDIALPMEGSMGVGGSTNIVFEADLTKYAEHRPAVLFMVVQPWLGEIGLGIGMVRMVRPWKEWVLHSGYDINQPPPKLTDAEAIQIVHTMVGDDSIPVKIKSTSLWTINNRYATRYSSGRVFCMGDAVHRHPPPNGLGSNTSIQDAYNLAWKLALVVNGKANPTLLDTYSLERAPVGRQIVERAVKSMGTFGGIFEALGLADAKDPTQTRACLDLLKASTPEAATRRAELRKALAVKNYEFSAHGVEMNQTYVSSAVVPDGTSPRLPTQDHELYYHPTTFPGARLPHVWLQRENQSVSTLDLVGKGRFTVLTGIGGEAWRDAASDMEQHFGIPVDAYTVGPARDLTDLYGHWAEMREIAEAGCLLVRPDGHIAWRAWNAPSDIGHATASLRDAMARILGRPKRRVVQPSPTYADAVSV